MTLRMWIAANTDGTRTRPAATRHDQTRPSRAFSPGSIALKLCVGLVLLTLGLLPEHIAAKDKTAYPRRASGSLSAPQDAAAQSATEARAAGDHPLAVGDHRRADFGRERASREAREIADWVVDSADNRGLPFLIVDKIDAKVFVFDAGGRIQGAAPALLGSARGDDTVLGIGDREFSDMPPATRTTPAGRFVAGLGIDTRGEDVLWVDYEAAVSLHRVITTKPKERRLERLATPTPLDNRISYGCINVPKRFYEKVVSRAFAGTYGIVYVLPETRPAREVFGSYDVEERSGRNDASRTQPPR
jgi:hypothetical protein